MGRCMLCFTCQVRACTMARNSPTLLVPSAYGPQRKNSLPVSVFTPRYSSLPGEPLQAASTQMEGSLGCRLAVRHFPSVEDLPLKFSYFARKAASASASLSKALYCAPVNPFTCFSQSTHEVKTPVLRPFQTT